MVASVPLPGVSGGGSPTASAVSRSRSPNRARSNPSSASLAACSPLGMIRRSIKPMVPPCSSSDSTATAKAISTSTGRWGVSAGKVCAAATVTAPRIPAQTTTVPSRQPNGIRRKYSISASPCLTRWAKASIWCSDRDSQPVFVCCNSSCLPSGVAIFSCMSSIWGCSLACRLTEAASTASSGATKAVRTSRVTANAAAAISKGAVTPLGVSATLTQISRICTPIIKNTAPSSTSSTVRQFCVSDRRFCGDRSRGAR